MKKFRKISIVILAFVFVFNFIGLNVASAATTPSLGLAGTFGVLSSTFTNSNTAPQTIISGDVGYTAAGAPVTPPLTITGTTHIADATHAQAGIDQGTALGLLNGQACTVIAGPLNATIIPGNAPGVFPPGCYTMAGAMLITLSTSITLDLTGPGGVGNTWIFKTTGGALTTGADSFVVLINGAQACNVFWAPVGATNIGAYTGALPNPNPFVGTIIDNAGISLGHFATLLGRALAFGGTVTTDANTITVPPACVAPPSGGSNRPAPIYPLINVTKIPSPLNLPSGPGSVTYTYKVTNIGAVPVNDVSVNDNKCAPASFISGDVNNDSLLDLNESWIYRCTKILGVTETNTVTACAFAGNAAGGGSMCDTANATVTVGVPIIPPLIHVVKIPSTFVLPAGGGAVTYMYTVTNPGTEPLHNVSITDDKCTGLPGRVAGHPGDLNKNDLLESNEAWSFTCQTNLTQTTTNIGTAEGSANGLTVIDFSPATVVVSAPGLPRTGLPPAPWNMVVLGLAGFLVIVSASLISVLNKHKR